MNDLNYEVEKKFVENKDEIISFKCDLHENLQKAMKDFIEHHPNWDQYRIIQAAIAGFLMQKGFDNRDLTRLYVGNMFSINFDKSFDQS
tara:strand:+ start:145 stop:411 length:267 start_codon:yes stop_codon:yes gene_type:complete